MNTIDTTSDQIMWAGNCVYVYLLRFRYRSRLLHEPDPLKIPPSPTILHLILAFGHPDVELHVFAAPFGTYLFHEVFRNNHPLKQ
jgi:hypothetical protein